MPDPVAKLPMPPARAGQRRYAAAVAVAAVAMLAAVVAFNVAVNPRGEFGSTRYRPLVLDQGLLKLRALDAAPPPAWVVLGSSRVQTLPPHALPFAAGEAAFNLGIAGAQPADYALLAGYLERTDPALAGVVWGVDTFAVSQSPDPILSLSGAYARVGGPAPSPGQWVTRLAHTVSASYARDSLLVLDYTYLSGYPPGVREFLADGTAVEVADDAGIAAGTLDLAARLQHHFDATVSERFAADRRLVPESEALLERTLQGFVDRGVAVKAFLPPMHPEAVAKLRDNPRATLFHDAALGLLLRHCGPGVQVFDFTEVASFNGTADGFYDNYHLRPANAVRLAAALGDGGKDLCAHA